MIKLKVLELLLNITKQLKLHKMENRGIYMVIYTGPGQPDNAKKPEWLTLSTGCCKFGQSLDLANVEKRYTKHLNGDCELIIAGRFKDRDDIDAIEKMLHHKLSDNRLININGRPSEWMEPLAQETLSNTLREVINERFSIGL